jgi:hypothetical protein
MDQGVMWASKSCYLIDETESKVKANIKKFWKKFNFKMAIRIIGEAWNDDTWHCLNGVCRNIWPAIVDDFWGLVVDEFMSDAKSEVA